MRDRRELRGERGARAGNRVPSSLPSSATAALALARPAWLSAVRAQDSLMNRPGTVPIRRSSSADRFEPPVPLDMRRLNRSLLPPPSVLLLLATSTTAAASHAHSHAVQPRPAPFIRRCSSPYIDRTASLRDARRQRRWEERKVVHGRIIRLPLSFRSADSFRNIAQRVFGTCRDTHTHTEIQID